MNLLLEFRHQVILTAMLCENRLNISTKKSDRNITPLRADAKTCSEQHYSTRLQTDTNYD